MTTAARLTPAPRGWYQIGDVSLAPALPEASDAALVGAMADGDRAALGALYDRYAGVLMAVAQRMMRTRREAEDLVHDVFLEAYRHAADYDGQRGTVRAWLVLRVRSRALDRLKSSAYSKVISLDAGPRGPDPESNDDPSAAPDCARVRRALADLPPEQRVILELSYFDGRSHAEIAEELKIPIGTIKSRLARALTRLRDELDVASFESGTMPRGTQR